MFDQELLADAQQLIEACQNQKLQLGTVESCTGGLLGGLITSVPGASEIYLGGLVTYANEMKASLVSVSEETLVTHGAVSQQTAAVMCVGGQKTLNADLVISITGIAGPGGGTAEKPVGLVYVGVALYQAVDVKRYLFGDLGRDQVRAKTLQSAIAQAQSVLSFWG